MFANLIERKTTIIFETKICNISKKNLISTIIAKQTLTTQQRKKNVFFFFIEIDKPNNLVSWDPSKPFE